MRHAVVELAIRDLKEGAGLEHVPSGNFHANCAWLQCAVLAHNLIRWTATVGQATPESRAHRRPHRPHPAHRHPRPSRQPRRRPSPCAARSTGRGATGSPSARCPAHPATRHPDSRPGRGRRTADHPTALTSRATHEPSIHAAPDRINKRSHAYTPSTHNSDPLNGATYSQSVDRGLVAHATTAGSRRHRDVDGVPAASQAGTLTVGDTTCDHPASWKSLDIVTARAGPTIVDVAVAEAPGAISTPSGPNTNSEPNTLTAASAGFDTVHVTVVTPVAVSHTGTPDASTHGPTGSDDAVDGVSCRFTGRDVDRRRHHLRPPGVVEVVGISSLHEPAPPSST